MKRFRTGVVIGKFYPPHMGHHYLIDQASAQCAYLSVLVCWKSKQNVPIGIRLACLREMHPGVRIIAIDDDLPDDDSAAWADRTHQVLGYSPDAVFTSEDYGDSYAALMGSMHVMVDRERIIVPCSGTMIRQSSLDHLQCLSPFMRAHYVKRICVVGAESTGTTTLARSLADHYHTVWVPEYGREYCINKWADGYTDEWTSDEFTHIAKEQSNREDAAARIANRVVFNDTDTLATGIWHRRYLGTRNLEVESVTASRHCDLYLLTGDEIPFEQDGYRDGESIRHWMHEEFIRELNSSACFWALISGNHQERMAKSILLVDEIIKTHTPLSEDNRK
ncbi:MAG: AAA family ATPase [Armatimonadota bacterium]